MIKDSSLGIGTATSQHGATSSQGHSQTQNVFTVTSVTCRTLHVRDCYSGELLTSCDKPPLLPVVGVITILDKYVGKNTVHFVVLVLRSFASQSETSVPFENRVKHTMVLYFIYYNIEWLPSPLSCTA